MDLCGIGRPRPKSEQKSAGVAAGLLLIATLAGSGCGEPGAPQPPSLDLPQPVHDLAAARQGNTVHLSWTTVDRTTDHTATKGPIRLHICRMEGTGPCELVTDQPIDLEGGTKAGQGKPASFDDALPTDILQGDAQLLTYYVELLNHGRKSAGKSGPAFAASGASVPEVDDLRAKLRPEGVELDWSPLHWPADANGSRVVRMERTIETGAAVKPPAPKEKKSMLASAPTPPVQMLEVAGPGIGPATHVALDRTAQFGVTYRYRVQAVDRLELDGHAVEIIGPESGPVSIAVRDIFPPPVPQQLAAVADAGSHAIDLSWSPDSEADLAGYVVYRRPANGNMAWARVSGAEPITTASFHDAQVEAGMSYAYSVAAVDQAGNESQRSAEADETAASQP